MFIMLVRHGRQKSKKMHPARVMMIKRVSSVDGVMGIQEEENVCKDAARRVICTTHPFRQHIWRTIGQKIIWSCLSSNVPRGAKYLYFLICKTVD